MTPTVDIANMMPTVDIADIITEQFGMKPDDITKLIELSKAKHLRGLECQRAYIDSMKQDPEFHAKLIQSRREWYQNNKGRYVPTKRVPPVKGTEEHEQYLIKKREYYAKNKEQILVSQRRIYHEKFDTVPKKKAGRPKADKTDSESNASSEAVPAL
jgi:hypothetical protein